MGEWGFLGGLFESLQAHSPMLGRFWLFLMLIFRIVILGTVASDLFEDEQEEFACNTLQPGCKQVCYDMAFPISQYRFWVLHIVLIATPSLIFLIYTMHHHKKKNSKFQQRYSEDIHLQRLYVMNLVFRILAEVGYLIGQWQLYGFKVEAQFPCSRFPCPYTVDCFTSRPAEKTIFLCFYFAVGVLATLFSCAELFQSSKKWFCTSKKPLKREHSNSIGSSILKQEEKKPEKKGQRKKPKRIVKSNTSKGSSGLHRHIGGKMVNSKMIMV